MELGLVGGLSPSKPMRLFQNSSSRWLIQRRYQMQPAMCKVGLSSKEVSSVSPIECQPRSLPCRRGWVLGSGASHGDKSRAARGSSVLGRFITVLQSKLWGWKGP